MVAVRRVLGTTSLALVFAAGWVIGDRVGIPAPLRAAMDTAMGQAATASQRAYASSEEYVRARIDESSLFDFDVHLPELPSSVRDEDLVVTREGNQEIDAAQNQRLSVVKLCPGMQVSNAPPMSADRTVQGLPERLNIGGILLRSVPVSEGCLSSGYGPRGGKIHKGIDFHHPSGSTVMAAADGVVIEAAYRDDYGHYVIIDHGSGIFTRYAHMQSFHGGIKTGALVKDGASLGRMGKSGGWSMPIHLHYEILSGNYNTPKRAFGLESIDPLAGAS